MSVSYGTAGGWYGVGWYDWADLDLIRARLDAGADPNDGVQFHGRPLRAAAGAETAAVTEARRLIAALGEFEYDGLGLACVAGITAAEAVRRLEAVPVSDDEVEEIEEDPWDDFDDSLAPATAKSRSGTPIPAAVARQLTSPRRRSSPHTSTTARPWPIAAPAPACDFPTPARSSAPLTCG